MINPTTYFNAQKALFSCFRFNCSSSLDLCVWDNITMQKHCYKRFTVDLSSIFDSDLRFAFRILLGCQVFKIDLLYIVGPVYCIYNFFHMLCSFSVGKFNFPEASFSILCILYNIHSCSKIMLPYNYRRMLRMPCVTVVEYYI
jgi:hypothetical protein